MIWNNLPQLCFFQRYLFSREMNTVAGYQFLQVLHGLNRKAKPHKVFRGNPFLMFAVLCVFCREMQSQTTSPNDQLTFLQ